MRKQVCGTRDHKPSFSFGINRVQSWGWGGAIQEGFLEGSRWRRPGFRTCCSVTAWCDPSLGLGSLCYMLGTRMVPSSQALMRGKKTAGVRCPITRSPTRSWEALSSITTHLHRVHEASKRALLPEGFSGPGTHSGLLAPPHTRRWGQQHRTLQTGRLRLLERECLPQGHFEISGGSRV